ncbi:MAG: ATP-binding cassette domain-containing protein [Alphaproteobacteria bacterium]|jgi:cell division transport system ATP-binding protein|nr:ATP-binding cassette domain-containing protein [Alphaproteobacteria bacterium]
MTSDAVLLARELSVGPIGPAPAIAGVDLALGRGDRLALVGANGTGKTALLATLALLAPPTGGRLVLFGCEPAGLTPDDRAALRRRIGAAFADELWMEAATTHDNLALPLRVRGEDDRTIAPVVGAFLDWLGLGAHRDTPVAALSSGERRLLAVARATVVRPDLLLLDEPLAGLDAGAAARATQLVSELAELGAAVIVATTDPATARRLGCELRPLADGRLDAAATALRAAS